MVVETRSRSRKRIEASVSKVGVILKAKKEAMEARARFAAMNGSCWSPPKAEAGSSSGKKKKVVTRIVSESFINCLKQGLYEIFPEDFSEEDLAKSSPQFREFYKAKKEIERTEIAYQMAILNQYNARGYAEDESEVDDDDDDTLEK